MSDDYEIFYFPNKEIFDYLVFKGSSLKFDIKIRIEKLDNIFKLIPFGIKTFGINSPKIISAFNFIDKIFEDKTLLDDLENYFGVKFMKGYKDVN